MSRSILFDINFRNWLNIAQRCVNELENMIKSCLAIYLKLVFLLTFVCTFIFELMLFVCIFCIRFDYFMFQHFCEKNLWKLKYWTTSRIDVIVWSSRLKAILNKLILKELNFLLIRISNENDVFFLCFYCYEYEICKKKTREFFDCLTHHLLQFFSMYKKIFTFVKSLIEMFSSNVSSSNELNNILIDKISSLSSTFLSRDDQHNKLVLFPESNANLQEIFREWWKFNLVRIKKSSDDKNSKRRTTKNVLK
jgi:hypothetical protein